MPSPSLFSNFVRYYNANFDRRPVPTLMITNGVLNTIADGVAQTSQMLLANPSVPSPNAAEFQPPPPSYDPSRTLRFALFGLAMGPLVGAWLRFLESRVPMKGSSQRQMVQLGKRVFMDQVLLAPVGLGLFVGAMGYMEGRDTEGVKQKFSEMYVREYACNHQTMLPIVGAALQQVLMLVTYLTVAAALLSNWKVWPLAQAVNFKLVPLQYRVPFQCTLGIAWNTYLSLLNARDDKENPT